MTPLPLDPTLLCREAEEWAETLDATADVLTPSGLASFDSTRLRSLASLLTQLSTLARAAGART